MKKPLLFFMVIFTILMVQFVIARHADLIVVDGAITPVTAKYIEDAVFRAEDEDAECLIIQMDTPGGLMDATWKIDKTFLEDRIPVVVYIYPSGGRAASAGVFISYASHVAAMAPSTNIGAAHPVSMVGKDSAKVMMEKVTNDAVAHIKGLSEKRGRNAEWAEEAIRNSVSITEKEALEKNVINLIANNLSELLEKLDGYEVTLNNDKKILNTKSIQVKDRPMGWQYQILNKIADPNILIGLLFIAGLGLYFELSNPGAILPGVLAVICIVLFLFGTQVLTINVAGLVFIILGFIFFVIEIYTPTYGILTAGGILSLILGSLMLFKSPHVKVSLMVLIPTLIVVTILVIIGLVLAIRTRLTKATTGKQGLIGEKGVALGNINLEGQVSVHGEVWKAESEEKIKKGEKIEVIKVDGLILHIKKWMRK